MIQTVARITSTQAPAAHKEKCLTEIKSVALAAAVSTQKVNTLTYKIKMHIHPYGTITYCERLVVIQVTDYNIS